LLDVWPSWLLEFFLRVNLGQTHPPSLLPLVLGMPTTPYEVREGGATETTDQGRKAVASTWH
jgi:hypothetical protein